MNKTTTYTVSIDGHTTRVRVSHDSTDDYGRPAHPENIARDRAIKKIYGASAYWWADSGLAIYGYGRVCKPSKYGGSYCVTDKMVRCDVESSSY